MRHSWKKEKKDWCKVRKPHRIGTKIIKVDEIKTCRHCGLMKGVQKGGTYMRWHNIIYFNQEGEFLSEERLPYECTGPQSNFLSKDDFYV